MEEHWLSPVRTTKPRRVPEVRQRTEEQRQTQTPRRDGSQQRRQQPNVTSFELQSVTSSRHSWASRHSVAVLAWVGLACIIGYYQPTTWCLLKLFGTLDLIYWDSVVKFLVGLSTVLPVGGAINCMHSWYSPPHVPAKQLRGHRFNPSSPIGKSQRSLTNMEQSSSFANSSVNDSFNNMSFNSQPGIARGQSQLISPVRETGNAIANPATITNPRQLNQVLEQAQRSLETAQGDRMREGIYSQSTNGVGGGISRSIHQSYYGGGDIKPAYRRTPGGVYGEGASISAVNFTENSDHFVQGDSPAFHLNEWTDNLKKWLSKMVFNALVKRIAVVDEKLISLPQARTDGIMKRRELTQLRERYNQTSILSALQKEELAVIDERLRIESYLEIPGIQSREFLLKRIRDLSEGDSLAAYRSEKSVELHGRRWDSAQLSDAAITFHLFTTFMDINMPCLNPHIYNNGIRTACTHRPFGDVYVFTDETPRGGDGLPNDVCIHVVKSDIDGRESFNVLVRPETASTSKSNLRWRTYDHIKPGPNNLFHAIVLFIHYVNRHHGRILRTTDLGGIINLNGILSSLNN
eukprot:CFRG2476T1